MSAMPILVVILCLMAIAYRYYSAFIAARVAVLDDQRITPALRAHDNSNFHPTNKWVLFGHHFAAISGAGPLVGPVVAAQFGYLPGLIWIVVGVCLAGAVQDFLVLVISMRRNGRSLAQIAQDELGSVAGTAAVISILFILIIALAGLGFVVKMALSGNPARHIPGSPWGTFTIACTIPIALFIGLYMNKIRPGKVLEASILGGALTIGATIAGGWVAESSIAGWFDLTSSQVVWSMAVYGFVASVLPVWMLLTPRDYLSSFLKIGTIALLVIGVLVANPKMEAPAFNRLFMHGGPMVDHGIFPFLFITIMCGAISGFHALVSSGTTPKMIRKESDSRTIGYGAMLIEGLVAVVAMIAACSLTSHDYYVINTDQAAYDKYQDRIVLIGPDVEHVQQYNALTKEKLEHRSGGAVTLAVGMAHIFDQALGRFASGARWLWKYWYHFAIMFEALFILTTIDAGTRIGRFLVQELMGRVHPKWGRANWWPGAIFATLVIVGGWTYFIFNNTAFGTIWGMFGVANQMLAVIALAIVSAVLFNEGKQRYLWVTLAPMFVVLTTTSTAAGELMADAINTLQTGLQNGRSLWTGAMFDSLVQAALIVAMLICAYTIIVCAMGPMIWRRSRRWKEVSV